MWLLILLFTFCLLGTTLPTIGSLWVLQANLVAYAAAQGAIASSTLEVDIRIEAPIFALLAALISDRLNALAYQRSRNLLWLKVASPEHSLLAPLCQPLYAEATLKTIYSVTSSLQIYPIHTQQSLGWSCSQCSLPLDTESSYSLVVTLSLRLTQASIADEFKLNLHQTSGPSMQHTIAFSSSEGTAALLAAHQATAHRHQKQLDAAIAAHWYPSPSRQLNHVHP